MWGRVVIQKKKDTNLITSNFLSPSLTYSIEEEEEEEEEKVEATFETYLKPGLMLLVLVLLVLLVFMFLMVGRYVGQIFVE